MQLDTSAAGLLNFASGVALATLGIVVAAMRGRDRTALALSAFCLGLGTTITGASLLSEGPGETGLRVALAIAPYVSIVGFGSILLLVPTPLIRDSRRTLAIIAAVAAAYAIYSVVLTFVIPARLLSVRGDTGPLAIVTNVGGLLSGVLVATSLFIYPVRFREATTPDARRTLALLAIAGVLLAAGNAGRLLGTPSIDLLGSVVIIIGSGLVWLASTTGDGSRMARNVAIAVPAILLADMFVSLWEPTLARPAARVAGVLFFAYAVLSGLIAGLDIKVRFVISKGTVAAAFVVVFFVASELAQQFFGQTLGGAYIGIAAAGLLVFALAPLQRAAERLAERAVPVGPAPRTPASSAASDIYRAALRAAMRDGVVTRREERHLAEVARGLGLDTVQAHDLRDQVENEP